MNMITKQIFGKSYIYVFKWSLYLHNNTVTATPNNTIYTVSLLMMCAFSGCCMLFCPLLQASLSWQRSFSMPANCSSCRYTIMQPWNEIQQHFMMSLAALWLVLSDFLAQVQFVSYIDLSLWKNSLSSFGALCLTSTFIRSAAAMAIFSFFSSSSLSSSITPSLWN